MNEKRLTTNGLTMPHLAYLLCSLAMIGLSIYLMAHFYETHFPKGINKTSALCDFNAFWGCDKATHSHFGSIFNVPTAFFGLVIGAIGIFGAIFSSERMESTNRFFIFLNAAGCLFLFVYSLTVLKGLCPMCTAYYVASWVSAFLFYKYSNARLVPDLKITGIYGLLVIVPSIFMHNTFASNLKNQKALDVQYIEQYKKLNDLGEPRIESPYKVHMSTQNFADAPIRISIFSDFQCPFCKVVSEQMHELIKEFDGKINIQYFFYPLDNLCNPKIKSMFHQFACKAAYIAACDPTKFAKVHDVIFERQAQLSNENLTNWEKEFGLEGCMAKEENKSVIVGHINQADQYNLKSTPTIIINGKKIEGTIKTPHFKAILRTLL